MRLVPVETLEKLYGTRYGLVVCVAKRTMRLREGSMPLVETAARNPLTVALLELAAGKVHPVEGSPEPTTAEASQDTEGEEAPAEASSDESTPEEQPSEASGEAAEA